MVNGTFTNNALLAAVAMFEDSFINCVCALFIHEGQVKFDSDGNGYIKGDIIDWRSFGRVVL